MYSFLQSWRTSWQKVWTVVYTWLTTWYSLKDIWLQRFTLLNWHESHERHVFPCVVNISKRMYSQLQMTKVKICLCTLVPNKDRSFHFPQVCGSCCWLKQIQVHWSPFLHEEEDSCDLTQIFSRKFLSILMSYLLHVQIGSKILLFWENFGEIEGHAWNSYFGDWRGNTFKGPQ